MSENPFNILNQEQVGTEVVEDSQTADTTNPNERINKLITENHIVLFVKGNPEMPQCGFSHNTMEIFNRLGKVYKTFNVLADPSIRQGIKDFTNWPTIPQVFVKGEFIGGNDVVTSLYQNGELAEMVKDV
ncbi:Grx4 family monothiol glutaredoxin [Bacteriovoracaceae bacterium]|nr:Grx4 family monothiol glutaredoxin [Bacteriovoracaceae bacterium]